MEQEVTDVWVPGLQPEQEIVGYWQIQDFLGLKITRNLSYLWHFSAYPNEFDSRFWVCTADSCSTRPARVLSQTGNRNSYHNLVVQQIISNYNLSR